MCFVEWEAYAAATLVARMADKTLDQAPVWDNVKTFDGRPWRGLVDCVVGGYPCQPFSVAGKRRGTEDPRHLWPHVARIVGEVRPPLCFFENVPNHLNLGFGSVCEDLWGMGYRVEAGIFSAAEVGAPHLRKRLFIMAHRDGTGLEVERGGRIPDGDAACRNNPDGRGGEALADAGEPGREGRGGLEQAAEEREAEAGLGSDPAGCGGALADPVGDPVRHEPRRWHGKSWPDSPFPPAPGDAEGWARMPDDAQPAVRRDGDGSSARVDRLRCLGNAVVPQVAALAWRALRGRFGE